MQPSNCIEKCSEPCFCMVGCTGAAWRSSARGVNRNLKWHNERNPCPMLQVSWETARYNLEEGGDDVTSAWPLCPGLQTWYNAEDKGKQCREAEQIPKNPAQFGLQAETCLHEAGIPSNRRSATRR